MSESIKGILVAINSRRDRNGNCYWALRYTDTATGRQVVGTVSGGESNIRGISYQMNGGSWEPRNIYFETQELPIREFDRLTKTWPYAGCQPEALAAFIQTSLETAQAA